MAKKILLIDDDLTFLKTLHDALTPIGYEVSEAHDGAEGLKMVSEAHPDLIIVDLMMPKLGGVEFLQTIQTRDDLKGIPTVISSNLSASTQMRVGADMNVRGYILKAEESLKTIVHNIQSIIGKPQ